MEPPFRRRHPFASCFGSVLAFVFLFSLVNGARIALGFGGNPIRWMLAALIALVVFRVLLMLAVGALGRTPRTRARPAPHRHRNAATPRRGTRRSRGDRLRVRHRRRARRRTRGAVGPSRKRDDHGFRRPCCRPPIDSNAPRLVRAPGYLLGFLFLAALCCTSCTVFVSVLSGLGVSSRMTRLALRRP
jgi:hypothetical protein